MGRLAKIAILLFITTFLFVVGLAVYVGPKVLYLHAHQSGFEETPKEHVFNSPDGAITVKVRPVETNHTVEVIAGNSRKFLAIVPVSAYHDWDLNWISNGEFVIHSGDTGEDIIFSRQDSQWYGKRQYMSFELYIRSYPIVVSEIPGDFVCQVLESADGSVMSLSLVRDGKYFGRRLIAKRPGSQDILFDCIGDGKEFAQKGETPRAWANRLWSELFNTTGIPSKDLIQKLSNRSREGRTSERDIKGAIKNNEDR